jgi:hypothetical protein
MTTSRRASSAAYWILVVLLVAFGVLAIFSVGAPFLLNGLALAVLWPARSKPNVFWPGLAGVNAFIVGYVLIAPLSCTGSETPGGGGHTDCFNLLGIDYSGEIPYTPALWPALLAGLAAAASVAAVTWRLASRGRVRR